jgi:hypothetical protein
MNTQVHSSKTTKTPFVGPLLPSTKGKTTKDKTTKKVEVKDVKKAAAASGTAKDMAKALAKANEEAKAKTAKEQEAKAAAAKKKEDEAAAKKAAAEALKEVKRIEDIKANIAALEEQLKELRSQLPLEPKESSYKKPINVGVGDFIKERIKLGLGNTEILKAVHEHYGNTNTTYACVAWYRNKMKV